MPHKDISLEERMTAIEVAVKYQSEQINEMKSILLDLRDEIAQRQVENGVQNSTLSKHDENFQAVWKEIDEIKNDVKVNTKKIYIGLGVAYAVSAFLSWIFNLFRR